MLNSLATSCGAGFLQHLILTVFRLTVEAASEAQGRDTVGNLVELNMGRT